VNDDKQPKSKPATDPNAPSDEDENPWDDDAGARTLATDGPSFELPSNIPSPITVPPPAIPVAPRALGGKPRAQTMIGFGPPGPALPTPVASPVASPAPIAAAPAVAAPPPAAAPPPGNGGAWSPSNQREDGPTMAAASPALASRPLRDDLVSPRQSPPASSGYRPQASIDKDADTMAALVADPRDARYELPSLDTPDSESEETTRAVSRDELIRHQDASVVIGEDAMGDEATLAVAPGQLGDLGIDPAISAALAESLGEPRREGSQPHLGSAPAVPAASPHAFHNESPGQPQQPQSWGGQAAPPFFDPRHAQHAQAQHPGAMQGYDPMLPGPPSSPGFPPSGQHPVMPPHQGYPMQGYGDPRPNANAPTNQGQRPPMGGPYGMGGPGQPAWMMPSPAGSAGRSKFTPQVIMLVSVGAVCLAIFIIGIVLFVTTKF
jgi:hypothetical protein